VEAARKAGDPRRGMHCAIECLDMVLALRKSLILFVKTVWAVLAPGP
jgi:hypothetical protein